MNPSFPSLPPGEQTEHRQASSYCPSLFKASQIIAFLTHQTTVATNRALSKSAKAIFPLTSAPSGCLGPILVILTVFLTFS